MKFELDYLKQLANVIDTNNLSELCIEDNGKKIILKKEYCSSEIIQNPIIESAIANEETEENIISDTRVPITSPMVGTFYASPSPDKEPYVKVGDEIKAGDTVCIIEAMKLLNEIESEISGKVVEICVENGQTIEFGQTLMYIV